MSILWFIIKVILIVLMVICVCILTVLGIILYSPIRYEAYVAKYEDLAYDIKITYLMGVKGIFYLQGEEKNHRISVFGKTLYKNKVIKEADKTALSCDDKQNELIKKDKISVQTQKEKKDGAHIKKKVITNQDKIEVEKEVNPKLKEAFASEVEGASDAIKDETVETIKEMPNKWIKKIVLDKTTYSALKQVLKCIWNILKCISPYEWDFECIIGEGDPAETGEMIAKLTMLYPLYYRHGIIRGDYERECLEGGFLVKGKFRIGSILWYILKCVLSKQVITFIRWILKIRKEEENGK